MNIRISVRLAPNRNGNGQGKTLPFSHRAPLFFSRRSVWQLWLNSVTPRRRETMDAFELDFSEIDPSQLRTDRHIRKVAEGLLPFALRQIGERKAQTIWESALQVARSHGDAPLSGSCEEYVRRTAEEYVRLATPELHDAYRRAIERRLRELVGGHVALPASTFRAG